MSESTSGLWHVNPETGASSRCRAKTPESCRWAASAGGLGHFQSKREADAAYEAYIASTADSKTTALSKMDHGDADYADVGDAGSTTAPVFERVSTLLTARVPLRTDREGRVPTLEPGDDSVKAQAKLASYLWKNFDGDPDEVEPKALEALYGEPTQNPWDCDYGLDRGGRLSTEELAEARQAKFTALQLYRGRMQDRLGGAEVSAYWQDGHAVLVCRCKRTASTMVPEATLTRSKIPVRVLNLGALLAADAVSSEMCKQMGGEMDPWAKKALANALLEGDRRAVSVVQLNGREYYGEAPTALSATVGAVKRSLGVDLGKPPELAPGASDEAIVASIAWTGKALATLDGLESSGQVPAKCAKAAAVYRQTLEGHLRSCWLVRMGRQGAYGKAVSALLDDEGDQQANYRFLARMEGKHSATVYEDKKNRDPAHDAAGRASSFSADFGRIEVDDSVDLSKFSKISREYGEYRKLLPASSVKPDLRFRLTGRHRATGVYTMLSGRRNMAVDPRYPSSFTHEWFHHLDFSSVDGKQLSRDPEFKAIVTHYRETIDREAMKGTDPDRYLAPTEIFARAGELWMRARDRKAGGRSSFLDVDEAYDHEFCYKPLLDVEEQVFAFMDKKFGVTGR